MLGRVLPIGVFLLVTSTAFGQIPSLEDSPKILVPDRPPTRQAIDGRDALKQFALGLLCVREDRLIEGLKAFEESARLDPQAAAVFKVQVPLLLALERGKEALTACERAAELDPQDHTVGPPSPAVRMATECKDPAAILVTPFKTTPGPVVPAGTSITFSGVER